MSRDLGASYGTVRHAILGHQHRRPKKDQRQRLGNELTLHHVHNGRPEFDQARARALQRRKELSLKPDAFVGGLVARLKAENKLEPDWS